MVRLLRLVVEVDALEVVDVSDFSLTLSTEIRNWNKCSHWGIRRETL